MPQPTLAELYQQQRATEQGLTSAESRKRLAEAGPNEPAQTQHVALLGQLVQFIANPLVVILLIAALIAGLLGEVVNASIIAVMVALSVALNFIQTSRSQKAAERLRAEVAPKATALRDGQWQEVPRREIVPGDVIRLAAGDLIPADARLIEEQDLHVQQAALTGESLPAEKEAGDLDIASDAVVDARNMVFLGTSVVSGSTTALVIATGRNTTFGDIAARLATKAPETEFEQGVRRFGLLIMRTVVFLVLFVFIANAAFHTEGFLHRPFDSLLFAVALAVGLTPEFLPMITTVTLGQGALHMARQKVIVKHLAAIQNFGRIDVLCSDKTGKLTRGDMTLDRSVNPLGASSE
jgi:Mg2+-importing ATPase